MTRNKSRGEYFWCVLTFRIKYLKLDDKCQWRVSSCLSPNTISPKLDRTRKRFKFKFEFAKFQKQFVSLNTWVIAKLELWFFIYLSCLPSPTKNYPSPYILHTALIGLLEHANVTLTKAIDRFLVHLSCFFYKYWHRFLWQN